MISVAIKKTQDEKHLAFGEVRPIPNYEGYYATDRGHILSCRPPNGVGGILPINKARVLKKQVTPNGYEIIMINRHSVSVHKIILEAFIGKRPKGLTAGHKNSNRIDNRLSNLYWATWKEQWRDKEKAGTYQRGEKVGTAKLTGVIVKEIKKDYIPYSKAYGRKPLALKYNVHKSTIDSILSNKRWSHISA